MEHAEGSILIEAPIDDVVEVIEDYEAYPEWADVRSADVRERGEGGRPTEVAFEVDVPVLGRPRTPCATGTRRATRPSRGTRPTPHGAVRDVRGEYLLDEVDPDTTQVTYRLAVELGPLVPGFIRTEGARRVIENALERLKRRVEMG